MITMYAWPSTADGPDALPMVHFTTDDQSSGEFTAEGTPVWMFDGAIRDGGWAEFGDFEGWSTPAEGWQAFYRREDDLLAVTGPGACEGWYQGKLGADAAWVARPGNSRAWCCSPPPSNTPRCTPTRWKPAPASPCWCPWSSSSAVGPAFGIGPDQASSSWVGAPDSKASSFTLRSTPPP